LTKRNIGVSKLKEVRRGRRSIESTVVHLTPAQSTDYRDALAKDLYNRLFLWLVRTINESTQPSDNSDTKIQGERRVISVLDIFGFENLKV
jgi:myosin heavy subunit